MTDLDLSSVGFSLRSLVEIGDHTKPPPWILYNLPHGVPPSSLGFFRWILRRHIEMLFQEPLHHFLSFLNSDLLPKKCSAAAAAILL